MRAPLHDKVLGLALDIVDASQTGHEAAGAKAYAKLKHLCERNAGTERDHPLQWEALGDFAESHDDSIAAYGRGLDCATRLRLADYAASIRFAIAEIHRERGDATVAAELARAAQATATGELKIAIERFLQELDT